MELSLVLVPGTHVAIPWLERPTIYDVRTRPHIIESLTGSRDLQMVQVSLRVLSHPVIEALPQIHRNVGENWD